MCVGKKQKIKRKRKLCEQHINLWKYEIQKNIAVWFKNVAK